MRYGTGSFKVRFWGKLNLVLKFQEMRLNLVLISTLVFINSASSCMSYQSHIGDSFTDACTIKENVNLYLPEIKINFKKIIAQGKDECVLEIVDSLTIKFITTSDKKYLQCLDTICQISDGYLKEHLWSIGKLMFYKNFSPFFEYLYERKNESDNCLIDLFIVSISVELNEAENRIEKRGEIDKYIENQIDNFKLSNDKIVFLKGLQAKFNDKILD